MPCSSRSRNYRLKLKSSPRRRRNYGSKKVKTKSKKVTKKHTSPRKANWSLKKLLGFGTPSHHKKRRSPKRSRKLRRRV